jgi:predicted protein tyrosine phosphatase
VTAVTRKHSKVPAMTPLAISVLTICGIPELPEQQDRTVTHVLSLLDPEWPEIEAFQNYGAHQRTTLRFHDVIEPVAGREPPMPEHVAGILQFGAELALSRATRTQGHLLVHLRSGGK